MLPLFACSIIAGFVAVYVWRRRGTASGADGLAIDSEGRVYVASNGGVEVFTEKGDYLGTIPFSRKPQNLAFAGPDKRTLYVVGRGAAYKVELLAQGFQGRAK